MRESGIIDRFIKDSVNRADCIIDSHAREHHYRAVLDGNEYNVCSLNCLFIYLQCYTRIRNPITLVWHTSHWLHGEIGWSLLLTDHQQGSYCYRFHLFNCFIYRSSGLAWDDYIRDIVNHCEDEHTAVQVAVNGQFMVKFIPYNECMKSIIQYDEYLAHTIDVMVDYIQDEDVLSSDEVIDMLDVLVSSHRRSNWNLIFAMNIYIYIYIHTWGREGLHRHSRSLHR